MNKVCLSFLFLVVIPAAPSLSDDGLINAKEQVRQVLAERIENTNAPSLSVAVAKNNKLVVAVAVGLANLEKEIPATVQTQYRTGSVAKVIGTTAFWTLVQSGKVSLDDNIREYLPYFPQKRWPITLGHLLTHTSGIRHYAFGEYGTNKHFKDLEAATRVFRDDRLRFEPGTSYLYSTYGINLIQGVIESVSDKPLTAFLSEELWQPANMTNTRLEIRGQNHLDDALGYRSIIGFLPVSNIDVSNKYIGGGMRSTPTDLVHLVIALNTDVVVDQNNREEMLSIPYPDASKTQSYGWEWIEYNGRRAFSHGGAINGFESYLVHFVESEVTVALMVNRDNYDHTASTTYRIADLFF